MQRYKAPRPDLDGVVVRLDDWQSRHVNPEGEIIEVLGPASAPGVDVLSIIRKYHLPTEFPSDVLEQAERIPESVDAQQIARREDLRNSSSPSTPTTRGTSTMQSMWRSLQMAVGNSECTSQTSQHMWSQAAR